MNIQFGAPLSRGWDRMKKALFQPFDIGKWFVLGFTAFLAGLADCQGNSGGNYSNQGGDYNWDDLFNFPQTTRDWLTGHPLYFNLIIIGIILIFIASIIFTWLSSRGKFMFLYNVINNKAEVKKPWADFKKEGNSLFAWRFLFGLFAFILFGFLLVFCFETFKSIHLHHISGSEKTSTIVSTILLLFTYIISIGYISLFLNDFVVPIMYKFNLTATQGWIKFLTIMWRHLGYFILYGLFLFVLGILVFISIVLAGIFTCCIGFVLLIIPYINAVVLLPVSYTFRAFSVEFLEQFGDEFSLFPGSNKTLLDNNS